MKVEEQESIESMMGERFSESNIDGENQKVPILTPSGLLLFYRKEFLPDVCLLYVIHPKKIRNYILEYLHLLIGFIS